jgi:hypothetical protein
MAGCYAVAIHIGNLMSTLIAELTRLYLPSPLASTGAMPDAPVALATDAGSTRAIVIAFRKRPGEFEQHWQRLCEMANLLQSEFDFPAPAVSVCASGGYLLWLSIEALVPLAATQRFVARLGDVHFPDALPRAEAMAGPVALPPGLNRDNGKWSAFIHPGMGASFADESGLDMPPPAAGQVAFLEGLRSIPVAAFEAALEKLGTAPAAASASTAVLALARPPAVRVAAQDGVLLAHATLEEIVRELHARQIEPTFKFNLPS